MSNEPLKYRATSVIEGEIYYSPDLAEQTEGNIELFEDKQEGYKIFAGLNSSSGKTLLRHLILEKVFYSKQDCGDFRSYAQEHIEQYFTRIKFRAGEYSATIDNPNEIESPGRLDCFCEVRDVSSSNDKILVFLTQSDYERLGRVKDKSLDEYIRRYNLTVQFSDSVLRLISLYGIAELIAYEKGIKKDKVNDFISNHLQIDSLIRCTRHLVAHGVVDQKNTLPELIKALRLNSKLAFIKFSREDRKQMDLVEESANKVATKLKQYLENQFLEG